MYPPSIPRPLHRFWLADWLARWLTNCFDWMCAPKILQNIVLLWLTCEHVTICYVHSIINFGNVWFDDHSSEELTSLWTNGHVPMKTKERATANATDSCFSACQRGSAYNCMLFVIEHDIHLHTFAISWLASQCTLYNTIHIVHCYRTWTLT